MNRPKPISSIVPAPLDGDRRPTILRPAHTGGGVFGGWGPKL